MLIFNILDLFHNFIITKFKRNLIGQMVLLQTEQLASNDMPVY